jgi:two-component system nitrogen regulation response regulator NtrX
MAPKKAKLLIVDDIADWRLTLRGLLEDHGYIVDDAATMSQAIDLLGLNNYSLALLDLRLDDPDQNNQDGLKLAKIIRDRWPNVKSIIVTGYGTDDVLRQAMEPNEEGNRLVDDYVTKEEAEKIVEIVNRVLI